MQAVNIYITKRFPEKCWLGQVLLRFDDGCYTYFYAADNDSALFPVKTPDLVWRYSIV